MRIISWNCNGALRKKFQYITELDAEVYVVQECEDPLRSNHKEYSAWAENHLWIGDNKNKGIGIFAKEKTKLQRLNWSNRYEDHTVKYFLPCMVNDDFQLLGVWTHKNNSPNFGYIGQFWKYLNVNLEHFENILIAGDFNSNVIWDQWDRWWNHSDVVRVLKEKGVESLYHMSTAEEQGKESQPTFYLQRKKEKPYHIDYFFGAPQFLNHLRQLEIGELNKWLKISDHLPIIADFDKQLIVK